MHRGAGSRSSPIFISDDEFDNESPQSAPGSVLLVQDQANAYSEKSWTADNHAGNSQQSSNSQPAGRPARKHKARADPPTPMPVAGPNKMGNSSGAQQSESKKRKREQRTARRRQEHTEKKARVDGSAQLMAQAMATCPPSFPPFPPTTDIPHPFFMHPEPYVYPPFSYQGFSMGQPLNVSTSDWVNSMASVAEPPPGSIAPIWNIYSDISQWPQISPPSGTQPRPTPAPAEPPPPPPLLPPAPSSSLPDKPRLPSKPNTKVKPAPTMIGMQSDRDPEGKRRTFRVKPTTHMDADSTIRFPYKPDPSCTLVMDQIPKIHRNINYIRAWCKSVSDCSPIFVAVEASNANAIIEFPSVELARKAWVSPRLGPPNTSGATIKGAPREDLIRVWWYLVSEPALEFTMKELEDGEIEDVAAMKEAAKKEAAKEAQFQSRREKKRVKKAMKEVEEKLVLEKASKTYVDVSEVHSPASAPVHAAVLTSSVTTPSAFTPFSPTVHHPAPSLPPIPQFSATEIFQQKNPLPPQSELASNWQAAPIDTAKISPLDSDPGSSLMTASPVGTNDMGPPSVLHSSLSSQSASQSEDMDVDIDMEVETPSSYNNPSPPLSYGRSSVLHASNEDTATIPSSSVASSTVSSTPQTASSVTTHLSESSHNFSTLTPTSNLGSPAASASPTPPPSEPRAMKNVPKGPSFVFRSMAVKQKELEERIARERNSIGGGKMDIDAPTLVTPPDSSTKQLIDNMAMEEKLRQLVLASQRRKQKSTLIPTPVDVSISSVVPRPLEDFVSVGPAVAFIPPPTVLNPVPKKSEASSPSDSALDDLAISFITETIQTLKTPHERPAATPPFSAVGFKQSSTQASATKQELAAKQRRLEQQIAESRTLMAKLSLAHTKQEKDAIMRLLRETNRAAEEDCNKSAKPFGVPPRPIKSPWPEASWNGILIVSDDEDDADSDDEGLL